MVGKMQGAPAGVLRYEQLTREFEVQVNLVRLD